MFSPSRPSDGNTPDDNIWYDFYREELGINLENLWTVAATEADQKISVSIASGTRRASM